MTDIIKTASAVKTALSALRKHPDWYFFKLPKGQKKPPPTNMLNDGVRPPGATNDPATVTKWSLWSPAINVGIAPNASRLVFMDVDTKVGKRGAETFAALIAKHGPLPKTLTVRTPSGGLHYWFHETPEVQHAFRQNAFGPDVDCPQYVLLPGSHTVFIEDKQAEGFYTTVDHSPIADAPLWFAEYLIERESAAATIGDNDAPAVDLDMPENIKRAIYYLKNDAPPSIQGSNGDKTLLMVCATLKDLGLSETEAATQIEEFYNVDGKCIPVWTAEECAAKSRNAWAYLKETQPGALGVTPEEDFGADPPDPLTPEELTQEANIRVGNTMIARNESYGKRKRIVITAGQDHKVLAAMQKVIGPQIDLPDPVFKRNGKLTRLSRNLAEDGPDLKHFEKDALVIQDITKPWLTTRATRSCDFGYTAREEVKTPIVDASGKPMLDDKTKKPMFILEIKKVWKPMNFPPRIAEQMLGDSSNWPLFQTLYSTTETPTLRSDGTILDKPGYDKVTGLLYDPGDVKFPAIESKPREEQGRDAIKILDDLLIDFPFDPKNVDEKGRNISKAVAVSMLLTSVVRRTLDIAPAYGIDADDQEAGKTTLAKVVGAINTGRDIAVQAFSPSEEERDKLLSALLLTAAPVMLFDNIDDTIEGRTMEAVITSSMFDSRPFGKNDTVRTAPTNTLTIFTGNKITVGGTLASRVLVCRLVPDKPFKYRTFVHRDIVKYVIKLRPALVAAILTALRCYLVHGNKVVKDTDRFPQWSDLIRSAVVWYGYADPQRGGDKLRENDPTKEAQREVLRVWWRHFQDGPITAADLRDYTITTDGRDRVFTIRDTFADGLKCRSLDVSSYRITPYVEKMIDVKLGMPVSVVKEPKRVGMSQKFHLELAPDVPRDWLEKEATFTAADDFADEVNANGEAVE
jgi:hypothetical protein